MKYDDGDDPQAMMLMAFALLVGILVAVVVLMFW